MDTPPNKRGGRRREATLLSRAWFAKALPPRPRSLPIARLMSSVRTRRVSDEHMDRQSHLERPACAFGPMVH